MWHYVVSLVSLYVFGQRVAANSAISEGLARVVLLQQGVGQDEISEFSIKETQNGYEEALGYYESSPFEETPTFNTTSGLVKGAQFNESYAFYSIPYAEPPARFEAPVPIKNRLPLNNATKANILVCEQLPRNCSNGVCTTNTNEDCLVLNIHVPRGVEITANGATTSVRPVLVWFHGGAFFMGGGTIPQFEARYFAEKTDTVIVAVNYRLGAFGFLVHGTDSNAIKGNFGIKDQQLALQWVQSNIRMFGGNPDMVTIFGESAGAQSVMFHLVSKKSRPYFIRAIMESNPAVFPYQTLDEAKRVSDKLVKMLNCEGNVERQQNCLKKKDPSAINAALPKVMELSLIEDHDLYSTIEPFRPVLDGDEFTTQPLELFREGSWNSDKDVILGTNANELEIIQYFIPRVGPQGNQIEFNESTYRALNRFIFGNETGNIVSDRYEADYGDGGNSDYRVILGIEASHMFFMCPSRLLARFAASTAGSSRVYLYNNAQPMNGTTCKDIVKPPEMCGLAFHGSDPPLVFRSGPFYGYEFRDSDTMASNQFECYWTNFATTGDPSQTGSIEGVGHSLGVFESWPEYDNAQEKDVGSPYRARREIVVRSVSSWQNIIIDGDGDPGNMVQDVYLEDICNFWDSLNYYFNLSDTVVSTTATEENVDVSVPVVSTTATETTTSGCNWSTQIFLTVYLLSMIVAQIILY